MHLRPLRILACLAFAAAGPAVAADWRQYFENRHVYLDSGHDVKYEIDAGSVVVQNGLVFYTYRSSGGTYDRVVPAVADCAAQTRADVADRGVRVMYGVFAGTEQFEQLSLACRLAKLPVGAPGAPSRAGTDVSTPPLALPGGEAGDWRTYDSRPTLRQIDARSVQSRDGLVFFGYREIVSYDAASASRRLAGVVDCAGRRGADVRLGKYDLRPVFEDTQQAAKLDLACKLAKAAPPPAATSSYSQADSELLWEEAFYTFDGFAFDYELYEFPSEDEARRCLADVACPLKAHARDERSGVRRNEMPPWLRAAIDATATGRLSAPVRDPGGDKWVVAKVEARRGAKFDRDEVRPLDWVAANAATALPTVAQLKADPVLRKRTALNRVFGLEELQAGLAMDDFTPADLDSPLSSGSTLLLRAMVRDEQPMADALLAAGASVDACGTRYCPLEYALLTQKHAFVRWLLAHGARVDRVYGGTDLPTPLSIVANEADQEGAQLLLDAKADPLATITDTVAGKTVRRSVAYYVTHDHPDFLEWLYARMQDAEERTGHAAWSAWIEQGGVRRPIVDGATIVLKAQPLRIVLKMADGPSFRVLASEDAGFLEASRSAMMRRTMLAPVHAGAVGPTSRILIVSELRTGGAAPAFEGASVELAWSADPAAANGTRRVAGRHGEHEDVHEVEQLLTRKGGIPASAFAGHALHVVAGAVPAHGVSSDFYRPARFDIVFR